MMMSLRVEVINFFKLPLNQKPKGYVRIVSGIKNNQTKIIEKKLY